MLRYGLEARSSFFFSSQQILAVGGANDISFEEPRQFNQESGRLIFSFFVKVLKDLDDKPSEKVKPHIQKVRGLAEVSSCKISFRRTTQIPSRTGYPFSEDSKFYRVPV